MDKERRPGRFTAAVVLVCLMAGGFLLFSQSPMIDFGALWVKAINADSEQAQKDILLNIFAPSAVEEVGIDKLLGLIKRLHADFSPLSYHHSEVVSFDLRDGRSVIMHVYAKRPDAVMWTDFQIRLEPDPPHQIISLGFIAEVSEPIALPNGSIERKETLDWLSGYIDKLKSEYDLSGSLLIAKGDRVLLEACFGYADAGRKIPVSERTLFNMASGGKMFTALGIASLEEGGRLSYGDEITKYLSGFPESSPAGRTTIHHLLSHTSGLAEYWTEQTDRAVYSATSINDHLELVYQSGFEAEPGTVYRYRNSNYILLGAIIEKITGKSFYDFIGEKVLGPAGMRDTGYFDFGAPSLAVPLARGESERDWIVARHGIKGSSAGGVYSRAGDLLKFSAALRNNTIVSGRTLREMTSPKNEATREPGDFAYGYGFILDDAEREKSYGHGGTADGVNFEFRYFPASDITLVVFSNQNNGAYDDLKRNTVKLITGRR